MIGDDDTGLASGWLSIDGIDAGLIGSSIGVNIFSSIGGAGGGGKIGESGGVTGELETGA
jgi:hypothetical protein